MLDSLVRVSRRVGAAADLLTTDMQTVPRITLAVRVYLFTCRLQSPEHRARTQGTNFTHVFGLPLAVRRVNNRRSAAASKTNRHAEILRHSNTSAESPST